MIDGGDGRRGACSGCGEVWGVWTWAGDLCFLFLICTLVRMQENEIAVDSSKVSSSVAS